MSALYIHVPFCATRCIYCDFFSNTEESYLERYLAALAREMALRKEYLGGEAVETLYFGGGTPSRLSASAFGRIFDALALHFDLAHCVEVTLEANPDDVTAEYLSSLRPFPFNRVSMGVQSFHADDLRLLNRRHTREQALRAVSLCREAGLENISIDLIYGLPRQTVARWEENLEEALRLGVPHLSAYHLTYETGTPLYRMWQAGKVQPVTEEVSVALFTTLIDRLEAAGYLHYEISNFALPGCFSRHNSAYWNGTRYLGLGPSAHSYNGTERTWNVASLPIYIIGMEKGEPVWEQESLDRTTRYNDYVITRLRTRWGISLSDLERTFGRDLRTYCLKQAAPSLKQGTLRLAGDRLTLTRAGLFISDGIMSDLLWI